MMQNSSKTAALGRRERNKNDKLARITDSASRLISERGIGEITTLQVAEAADVAVGTLFLYAETKGELLLLAQNAAYRAALQEGKQRSSDASSLVESVVGLWQPIIACNRKQVENGRAYLKEVVFGESRGVNRREALALMAETEKETAELILRFKGNNVGQVPALANVISGVVFLVLSSPNNTEMDVTAIIEEFATRLRLILGE